MHKLGEVCVSQPSVTIVAVSPHRRCAIEVASQAIELVKQKVPIWKKEFYKEEQVDAKWKENPEWR